MSKNAVEKSPFSNLVQVGVVVKDLEKTGAYLSSLGMGSFASSVPPPKLGDFLFRGKPSATRVKARFAPMGGVDIELIQPAEGPSLYQEFLDSKGDGIHHIAFSVDDVDESVANLAKQGIGVSFSGKWQGGGFAYVETDAVGGIIIELLQGYKKKEMDKNLVDSPFSNFIHVGVVVKDLDKTIEFLSSLGIGPFEIPVVPPLKGTSSFRGKPYPSFAGKLKTKRAKMGGFELHLYQPVEGETPFKEFLDLKGEGIHHLAFHVDDIDKEFARLTKHDIGVLFEGKWNVGGFTYFETPVGGLVLELEQI